MSRIPHPSRAMIVALVALLVSLSGTAWASGVVPLAKRALSADNAKHALIADNAKKIQGQTAAAVIKKAAALPGPASTAAGLVTIKTGSWTLTPGAYSDFTVTCDAGQKAIGYGWEDPGGWAHEWDSRPSPDGGAWKVIVTVSGEAPGQQTGPLYAVCLK